MYSSLKWEKIYLVCDILLLYNKPTGMFCCLSHLLVLYFSPYISIVTVVLLCRGAGD